ncbi:uncharacterized protein [Ptychodera flava]|uniref:uncharacterized protein isoform X2 n=1 Tax=Ptychodera flava TaxID=63121 RepID=UPI003969D272
MEGQIINSILKGHNILILGQAGTGKTALIRRIASGRRRCAMTATTGMAASLLFRGQTVHRCFGLMDGRFNDEELVERITQNLDMKKVKDNILNTELLFIDEISMMSAQTFLQIETVCRMVRQSNLPFGGMQVVLSGDLYQLKPVPNMKYGDPGKMIIEIEQFRLLIPHHYVLTKIYRQSDLIEAVHFCSQGKINDNITQLLTRLQRQLPPGPQPVKLFALNYDVELCNAKHLMAMEGQLKAYKANDTGDIKRLSTSPVSKTLHLKEVQKW